MKIIDFQGTQEYYPTDFALGEAALDDLRTYTGVAVILFRKGTSTTKGLDMHRTELIKGVLASRRDLFNPSLVLMEENVQGGFNASDTLTKIIVLDKNKLSSDYEDNSTIFNNTVVSRDATTTNYVPTSTPTYSESTPTYSESTPTYPYNKKKGRKKKNTTSDILSIRGRR